MEKVIDIKNLCKSFGDVKAVQNLSFCVKRGEFFAFLGENGAGKSTTISIICNQLRKDSGEVFVCGKAVEKSGETVTRKLGVVFQGSVLDAPLTVKDNLENRAALYGISGDAFNSRLSELAKMLDFEQLLNRTVGKLSGGQRRRIDIARALLHKPEILVLDEPTTGLDPQTRRLLWDAVTELRKNEGLTVFLTTHYMEEAAEADYIVILDSGKIAAEGTPLALKNAFTGDYVTVYGKTEAEISVLEKPYTKVRDGYKINVKSTSETTEMILKHPSLFNDFEVTKGKMDDVFLAVTGKTLTGGEEK